MKNWYVLHTMPHKERQVAWILRTRNVEIFLPMLRVNPVNPRAARERAYVPNYLFACVDLGVTGLSALQWTPGLRRLVEFGDQPAVVQENLITDLKRKLSEIRAAGGLTLEGLHPGDSIRIKDGPFEGYQGIFDARLSGIDRVRVLLDVMENNHTWRREPRVVPVELNAGTIDRLNG
jgi:transcriptional antiterminator RfaH